MTSSFVDTILYSVALETSVLIRTIESLHRQGYVDYFSLMDNQIVSRKTGKVFFSGELVVDEILCCDQEGCEGFKIYAVRDPLDQSKGILTILLPGAADRMTYDS